MTCVVFPAPQTPRGWRYVSVRFLYEAHRLTGSCLPYLTRDEALAVLRRHPPLVQWLPHQWWLPPGRRRRR